MKTWLAQTGHKSTDREVTVTMSDWRGEPMSVHIKCFSFLNIFFVTFNYYKMSFGHIGKNYE